MDLEKHLEKYKINDLDSGNIEYFIGFINIMFNEYNIDVKELRSTIPISTKSFERWKEGLNLPPYSITRKAIIKDLTDAYLR
jgi:hypothetical protein